MPNARVFVVHYHEERGLKVSVDGESVPMDDFVQTYSPLQVSALTARMPGDDFVALMIAEAPQSKAQKGPAPGAWPKKRAT